MIHQTKEGWWVISDDSHHTGWIEQSGLLAHDKATLPAIRKYIPISGVVVDGGAHVGTHTVFYLECVGEEGLVISFEPNPLPLSCLTRNCPDAVTYQLGLSDCYGAFSITHDLNYGGAFLGSRDGSIPVFTIPLDALDLQRLDFLKLDVEGCEVRALIGALETIKRCKPVMLIEVNVGALERQGFSKRNIHEQLWGLDYRFEYLFPSHNEDMPQTDIICFPK